MGSVFVNRMLKLTENKTNDKHNIKNYTLNNRLNLAESCIPESFSKMSKKNAMMLMKTRTK